MELLHELEVTLILIIQALGTWLVAPMQAFSFLGREEFFMAILPLLYWCVDGALGLRLAVVLLVSNGVNSALKLAFNSPRPYWIDNRVGAFSTEESFGMPSNHAQVAASVWGFFATLFRRAWVKIVVIAVIFFIGFSRIYLGMHFISDVIAGWILGGLVLLAVLKLEKPAAAWLKKQSMPRMIAAAFVSSLLLIALVLAPALFLRGWQAPGAWTANVAAATPGAPIDPLNLDNAFTLAGTWFGMLAGGAYLYHRQGLYSAQGTARQKAIRYIIGIAGVLAIYLLLGRLFPREQDFISFFLRYFRYMLIGLWVSAAAPLLFERMGLSAPAPVPGKPARGGTAVQLPD